MTPSVATQRDMGVDGLRLIDALRNIRGITPGPDAFGKVQQIAYSALEAALSAPVVASPPALEGMELRALRSAMANAEHDAGDVDDIAPRIEDDEDAYWAYQTYHGLRKLLAASPAPAQQAVGDWIPVSERLPEMDQPVWLVDESGHVWIGARGDTGDGWLWGNAYDSLYRDVAGNIESADNEADDDYRPTHWHVLPNNVPAPPAASNAAEQDAKNA